MDFPFDVEIGFSSSHGIGQVIRFFTGGDVNHCFIKYIHPVYGLPMVLGANPNGLTEAPLRDFLKDHQIVHTFKPLLYPLTLGLQKNADWLNKPYDYAGLIGMAEVEAVRRIAGWQIKNPLLDRHRLFCSEFGAKVARESGYAVLPGVEAGAIDPEELCKAMLAAPAWFEAQNA